MAKSAAKALSFWAYLALAVSLLALLLPSANRGGDSPLHALPADLRRHYSAGKLLKIQSLDPTQPFSQIFAVEDGPRDEAAAETVLLLHGLGCSSYSFRNVMRSLATAGMRSVAVDFPGAGFSDKLEVSGGENLGGPLNWVFGIYREIRQKGIFWGFDQLVETGQIPGTQQSSVGDEISVSEMAGRVVGQALDEMSLRVPVHLVVHDSALGAAVSWVSANLGSVSSITLLDSSPAELPAFPFRFLETSVVGDVMLRSRVVFGWLAKLCCWRAGDGQDAAEVYRVLMKDNVAKRAIVMMGKGLNYSFDLGEWAGSEGVTGLKFQVLWSNTWSDRWIDEGRRIAALVPQARFSWHSGGRWPQEDAAEEIAGMIAQFVLTLPKSTRPMDEEPKPEHIKRVSDDESGTNHHHHHGHGHGHGHDHGHADGYFSTYGLGQEWGS